MMSAVRHEGKAATEPEAIAVFLSLQGEARKLIEAGLAAYTAKVNGGHKHDIYVADSKLWTSGAIYSLTQIDQCWPKQPPAKMPGWGGEQLPYEVERGKWIRVNRNGVAPSCRANVRGALLGQGGDGAWYAHRVKIVTHKPELGEIVEILSRGDMARVRYMINWKETAMYKKCAQDDPALMARYPAPSGDLHLPLKMPACLVKYDQGWRLEGFGAIQVLRARDLDHRVREGIELGARLADLGGQQLVHEGLTEVVALPGQIVGRPAAARYAERKGAAGEQRQPVMILHSERRHLALLDELDGLEALLRRDVVGRARLILGAELARPPPLVDRIVLGRRRPRLRAERKTCREQCDGGRAAEATHRYLPQTSW